MTRVSLQTKYFKTSKPELLKKYRKQKNYCSSLYKKERKTMPLTRTPESWKKYRKQKNYFRSLYKKERKTMPPKLST